MIISSRFFERDGEVIMKFKHWHADEDWKPLNGEKTYILKADENGQQMIPAGVPEKVAGAISEDVINTLKGSIAKTKVGDQDFSMNFVHGQV